MTPDAPSSVASLPPRRLAAARPDVDTLAGPEPTRDDIAVARRDLRIRLLRDLVANGLYQVPTEALADRLVAVVIRPA